MATTNPATIMVPRPTPTLTGSTPLAGGVWFYISAGRVNTAYTPVLVMMVNLTAGCVSVTEVGRVARRACAAGRKAFIRLGACQAAYFFFTDLYGVVGAF
jgi:hypothetical protein